MDFAIDFDGYAWIVHIHDDHLNTKLFFSIASFFRLWDIECGACLRVLEGHEELVRCIRFDSKRIVSGAYDGKIKVWDLVAALDPRAPASALCLKTLEVSQVWFVFFFVLFFFSSQKIRFLSEKLTIDTYIEMLK